MSLYNVKAINGHYQMTKFDEDLNPLETYKVESDTCECKAAGRPTCRHRQMLPSFQARARVNTGWFFDFDENRWFFLGQKGLVNEASVKRSWRRL